MIFGNIFGSTKSIKSASASKFQIIIFSGSSCPLLSNKQLLSSKTISKKGNNTFFLP